MRPRVKPAALGRWTPPEDSVTWRSAWSVDPAHASVGYARALFGLALLAAALLLWILARQGEALALPEALRGSAQVMRRARSAPWTVGAALLALMTLGTTKRCFDFGRGTLFGLAVIAAAQVLAPLAAPLVPAPAWALGLALGLLAPALAASLARAGRHAPGAGAAADIRRQALATSAWLALAFFVGLAAYEDLASPPALPPADLRRLLVAGGLATGAAVGAALPLRRLGAS